MPVLSVLNSNIAVEQKYNGFGNALVILITVQQSDVQISRKQRNQERKQKQAKTKTVSPLLYKFSLSVIHSSANGCSHWIVCIEQVKMVLVRLKA